MADAKDDYSQDMDFGKWLKQLREASGQTIEQIAQKAQLTPERLRSLELGYSERGITKPEATRLAKAYNVETKVFLARAVE